MRLPNFGYHLALRDGSWRRQVYRGLLPAIVRRPVRVPGAVPFSVFAYSSEQSLPEQVRSIRSFLRHVGRPKSFTVVSDGSHSARSIQLLQAIDPSVSVQPAGEQLPSGLAGKISPLCHDLSRWGNNSASSCRCRAATNPRFTPTPTFSFLPAPPILCAIATAQDVPAYYLLDCQPGSDDPRLFRGPSEALASGQFRLAPSLSPARLVVRHPAL